ncbi:MAG: undecaprenyldiphospho-muramoylpentapeptide beta-N-acetylglucosaminyltransferase [Clostridia bacterium]|nr:undecaprenyldiphospho-muramoylpentapeptide beta-N-acetylglucosaminyltransferase [Clostridia bacterium]
MRVLLTGGGSAGHINPALAIAHTIQQNDPHAVIEFVGIKNGKETELVPREGYPLHFVESQGFRRSFSLSNLRSAWLALTSPYSKKTKKILKDFQPDIVIGTGGFACWPLMAAAARMGIPTAVHESNSLPGLTIRLLQNKVDCIWTNFESTANHLKTKRPILKVGNPLRGGFGGISKAEARRALGISAEQCFILSFGGSLGAEEINRAVIRTMAEYTCKHPRILHLHATGKRDAQEAEALYREKGLQNYENCVITDYIHDMSLRMAAADLVISRAGAVTLSELALLGKAAILIPSPYVAENHQYLNAKTIADANAAVLIEESTLVGNALQEVIRELVDGTEKRKALEENIRAFADPKANQRIWEEILRLTEAKTKKTK